MGEVVLDVVDLGPESSRVESERLRKRGVDIADFRCVLQSGFEVARARTVPDRAEKLLADVRPGVARDGEVVEVVRRDSTFLEAPAGGEARKPGDVFDPAEALLFGGRDELAVDDEGGGCVAVVRVQAEYRGHPGRG